MPVEELNSQQFPNPLRRERPPTEDPVTGPWRREYLDSAKASQRPAKQPSQGTQPFSNIARK